MTKDDIIRMASQAGWDMPNQWDETCGFAQRLEKFYEIVAAADRERCAKVCEEFVMGSPFAAAIRAMGEK